MARRMKIDFVSDISCPWCIIGLRGLDGALKRTEGLIEADIRFHPFQLNPSLPPEGRKLERHIAEKIGASPDRIAATRAMIRERAAETGFTIAQAPESRIYNTFDAHRLLHWAHGQGRQKALKEALFAAYFSNGRDPSSHDDLVAAAEEAGLDAAAARDVLESGRYADEVRADEQLWRSRGIKSVPAIVVDDAYLISGGQPVATFEAALRRIAAEPRRTVD